VTFNASTADGTAAAGAAKPHHLRRTQPGGGVSPSSRPPRHRRRDVLRPRRTLDRARAALEATSRMARLDSPPFNLYDWTDCIGRA
jgi:hypothetical protein